jgi:hypothetical protein
MIDINPESYDHALLIDPTRTPPVITTNTLAPPPIAAWHTTDESDTHPVA